MRLLLRMLFDITNTLSRITMVVSDVAPLAPHDSAIGARPSRQKRGESWGGERSRYTIRARSIGGRHSVAALRRCGASASPGRRSAGGNHGHRHAPPAHGRHGRAGAGHDVDDGRVGGVRARQHGRRAARRAAAVLPDDDRAAWRRGVVRTWRWQLLEHARPRCRAHARAIRRLSDAAGGQARPGQCGYLPDGARAFRRRRHGRRFGCLRRGRSRRRHELHPRPRVRRPEVLGQHRHERVRQRRQELEPIGRGRHGGR